MCSMAGTVMSYAIFPGPGAWDEDKNLGDGGLTGWGVVIRERCFKNALRLPSLDNRGESNTHDMGVLR